MKKFNFSLQKVLDFREFEKKQAEAELGKAVAEEAKIQDTLEMIARAHVSTVQSADSTHNVSELFAAQNYFRLLSQRKEESLNALAQAQIITEEKRGAMREAMKNCKVLENLRDKRKETWKKENIKTEENDIDDIVTSKYGAVQ
ncbi:flagellar export protein FliJ [Treponema sp.]|uniref:flagellar export protein FliJ n=1 Tax=Treponema sp. TaxID=166 RepID=UPI00388FC841